MLARAKRDYYAVLGVPPDADRETIRRAFRTLAAEVHPDVSSDASAPARFREIAEAYEVLSRSESRAGYDRRHSRGFAEARSRPRARGGEPGEPDAPQPGTRGADVVTEAEIEFVEAAQGTTRGLRYAALLVCPECAGTGGAAQSALLTCVACAGRGRVREVGSAGSGRLLRLEPCGACRGTGRVPSQACARCAGQGSVDEERSLLVVVSPGAADGDVIRLRGEGNVGGQGGEPGDVVVRLRVRPAPDHRLVRRLAAAGVAVAVALVVVTLALH